MKRTIRIEIDADEETCKGDCPGLSWDEMREDSVCAIFLGKTLRVNDATGICIRLPECKAAEAREVQK